MATRLTTRFADVMRIMQNSAGTRRHLLSGEHMRRITKAALGGLATSALILGATQAAGGASSNVVYSWSGDLADLRPDVIGPLDGASASLRIVESPDEGTGFRLKVTGIDTSLSKATFGAHLHVGECTERVVEAETLLLSPDTTGPHYTVAGEQVSHETEVWFELVPDEEGAASDESWVPFVPEDQSFLAGGVFYPVDGLMSIVLHRDPTAPNGVAGPREACLPVVVSDWIPTPVTG